MDLEINHWNETVIDDISNNDDYASKINLVESIINDSNYVSEDSVTLTEGSVEKDEDSLDYQNDDPNIYSMTNSMSDVNDINDNKISKDVISCKTTGISKTETVTNMIVDKSELHNIVIESDDEVNKYKSDLVNENVENFYDCEEQGFKVNMNRSNIELENLPSNCLSNETKNEQLNGSSDELSLLNIFDQDFTSSNWLIQELKNDEFDCDSIFSFKKIKLSNCKIFKSSNLNNKLTDNCPQLNNYLTLQNSSLANESPIDFAVSNIHIYSTPYLDKHKNQNSEHRKNETFSKSGSLEFKSPLKSLLVDAEIFLNEFSQSNTKSPKNRTFNLEEPKENILDKHSLEMDQIKIENDNEEDNTVPMKVRKTFVCSDISKLQKPNSDAAIENPPSQIKQSRFSKKLGSLLSFQNKEKPSKELPKSQKESLIIKPPSLLLKKSKISKAFSRDSVAPKSNKTEIIVTRSNPPPIDLIRRHTLIEELNSNDQIASKPTGNSRPTSLIKPNEMKPPIGNLKIGKSSFRSSAAHTPTESTKKHEIPASKIGKSIPVPPKNIKSMKIQGGFQKSINNRLNSKPVENNTHPSIIPPILSENPPIISPTNNSINNPLNRTFDREDFQILKSFNNSNNNCNDNLSESSNETVRSMSTDSENNNKTQVSKSSEHLGIYELAKKEEENLKKHVNSALIRQTTFGFRSLKLPTQIKPRGIPLLKK